MTWPTACAPVLAAGLALVAACGRSRAIEPPAAAPSSSPAGARLVVLLVIDQLPSRALDRYGDALHADGLVRRSARRGVWIERVSFPYAGTYTSPGHAAIATGTPPRDTGVATSVPAWLLRWTDRHPVDRLLVPWTPALSGAVLERLAGPDAGPGERPWLGLDTTFPHDPRASEKPFSVLRAFPSLNDDLLALADAAIDEYRLGADEVPDLLAVSISTVDYAGHAFGPDSWEYADALVRIDRQLGAWLDRLERRTSVAVLVTSDHGVTPLPERSSARAGRIDMVALKQDLEAAIAARLGPGEWIDAYAPPFVYLSANAETRNRRLALATVTEHLSNRADIAWAGPVDRIAIDRAIGGLDGAALRAAVELSVPAGGEGDIFVVPAPSHVVTEDEPRQLGTSHGSPWPDDREVPFLFYGPGVAAGEKIEEPLPQERVAATLAALLGIAGDWPRQPLPLRQLHADR